MNTATMLTLSLPVTEILNVQRKALNNVSAGILTLEEVAQDLGIHDVKGTSCNSGCKGADDCLRAISGAGSYNAARILSYCRVAHISEQCIIYDLGGKTKQLQSAALCKRFVYEEFMKMTIEEQNIKAIEMAAQLPPHAHSLHLCTSCGICNTATVDLKSKALTFNEIGCPGVMAGNGDDTHLYCARKPTASRRTSLLIDEKHNGHNLVEKSPKEDVLRSLLDHSEGKQPFTMKRTQRG